MECLVEFGWSGTSTTLVSQRAGVSRGAQLHHFPTKADLVLAAVEHLSDARREDLRAAAADLPTGRRRTRAVLETHRSTVELLGFDQSEPGVRELVQATLDLVRGLGLANTLTDDAARRKRILDEWAAVLDTQVGRS